MVTKYKNKSNLSKSNIKKKKYNNHILYFYNHNRNLRHEFINLL